MGWKWEVELWCVTEAGFLVGHGGETWGWEVIYRGQSLKQALTKARQKRKETDGAVRITLH